MKATATKTHNVPAFEPITVSITFETQRELDIFGALFSYTPICDLFRTPGENQNGPDNIRDAIMLRGADCYRLFSEVKARLKSTII
jgi:hypothetical protein